MQKQEIQVNIISFTETGSHLARQIKYILEPKIVVKVQESRTLKQPLREWCKETFAQSGLLIFVGAVGIAVRLIAPYVKDKFADPAVLAVDEQGNFVIPILSGHVGGANEYAIWIAKALDAVPVITTATDLYGKFAVDVFAAKNGLTISDRMLAKKISAAVLRGEKIGFFCEADVLGRLPAELVWMETPQGKKIEYSSEISGTENLNKFPIVQEDSIIYKIHVGVFKRDQNKHILFLHPKILVLGIGCKKGKSLAEIEDFVKRKFQEQELAWDSVCAVASVEQKKQEQGLLQFCHKWQLPFYTFLSEELAEVPGVFAESKFVEHTVGVGNVCERAAVRCAAEFIIEKKATTAQAEQKERAQSENQRNEERAQFGIWQKKKYFPRLLLHKTAENGITLAITKIDWSVRFE